MNESNSLSPIGWRLDNSYARLPDSFYVRQAPNPVRNPSPVLVNDKLAAALGLDAAALRSPDGIAALAGNRLPEGSIPIAEAYAGHQFRYFTMLGDGRAVLLGEQLLPSGGRLDVQLKGSGRTPFSRQGDGRAALGPMLREYVISEAMHGLGIPTTRSLAVTATGQPVQRERELPGAVLTRIAASHLRVGTFEYAAGRGDKSDLTALADYAIQRHDPGVAELPAEERYLRFLEGVIKRQASLIAQWQLVGFVHGVMNTDNMTISGETIDYGPCAFLDTYDPATVFSSIDRKGRYAFGNQPSIAVWNLARLAEALLPLLHEKEEEAVRLAEEAVGAFADQFREQWLSGMRAKLGLVLEEAEDDEALIEDLLALMKEQRADYTNTFRTLTLGELGEDALCLTPAFSDWKQRWKLRQHREAGVTDEQREALMRRSNPAVIPRNHRVEEALEAAEAGDLTLVEQLLHVLENPYAYSPEQQEYASVTRSDAPYRTFCGT